MILSRCYYKSSKDQWFVLNFADQINRRRMKITVIIFLISSRTKIARTTYTNKFGSGPEHQIERARM